jgi:type II secretory pathway pseudopilin PulG
VQRPNNPAPKILSGKRVNDGGFTLIETIASIIIILVAVVGLFAIFTNSIASRNTAQPFEVAVGTQYVQEKLEMIYANKRNPRPNPTLVGFDNIPLGTTNEIIGNGYTRVTTVGQWSVDTDTDNYKQVTVQVLHNGALVAQGVVLVARYQ